MFTIYSRKCLAGIGLAFLLLGCQTNPEQQNVLDTTTFDPNMPPAELLAGCEQAIATAEQMFAALETNSGPNTLDTVVGGYDAVLATLQPYRHTYYMKAVHPDADIRQATTDCSLKLNDFDSRIGLSRPFYDRLAAIDTSALSTVDQYVVAKMLQRYELAGVDQDADVRAQIRSLQKEISEIGDAFGRNIQEDVRYVETTIEQLSGLPQDYLDAHPPDENGVIKISTNSPEYGPVMLYGHSDELRKALRVASRSRGYPQNKPVMENLLAKRRELAQLLGFETFAAVSMRDKMIETPTNAAEFLSAVSDAIGDAVQRDKDMLLKRLQQIDPDAQRVEAWQVSYLMNLIREEDYALDSKLVRTYFDYDRVRDGIFKLTENLFSVSIEPWDTDIWHEDVETFQMFADGELIGQFYIDSHPRPNKFKHAAAWSIRAGLKDKQIPISGLAQNFPDGLMEHGQVETFLHEFGHLLHNMFANTQRWSAVAGMSMERDFVEAPSQMLEEWIWDYETLSTFAQNEAGETIPKALVERMNAARDLGKAFNTAVQLYYGQVSLAFYTQEEDFDLDELMLALAARYSPSPHVPGTHLWANFGHLYGYSSNYYTYQWSLAIATDLFSQFLEAGLSNTEVAMAYRDKVLGAAGSQPAREFIRDFLGREFSTDAYIQALQAL